VTPEFSSSLPIDTVLPQIKEALQARAQLVIVAPPGAGKTTRVPLALLNAPWMMGRKIILLEPRRLAARAAANRMAAMIGEGVGETIGLRMRLESKVSDKTRIEIVTEGVFVRMILDDPALENVGCVLFDEYHERSLDADVGLALALDAQEGLRNDLKLIAMSATIDAERVATLMHEAPVIVSQGRAFDVEMRYLGRQPNESVEDAMIRAIKLALREERGSILAFLPGQGEILRVARRLTELDLKSVLITSLYGAQERVDQERAIAPPPAGQRKVTLATTIAETSLTIEGVRIVIDCGLSRVQRYEPDIGLSRLETVRAARASVEQRAGRAGRMEPGVCYRLWDEQQTKSLQPFLTPEILTADLASLVLDLAAWGVSDPGNLRWLDPPEGPSWKEAISLNRDLGALDADGRLTEAGHALHSLPLAPRLARMVIVAASHGHAERAADLAMLLSERGLGGTGVDLSQRLERFNSDMSKRAREAKRLASHWARQAKAKAIKGKEKPLSNGALIMLAFPDRLAKSRGARGEFLMVNGRAASLLNDDALSHAAFLAIAELTGRAGQTRIIAACAMEEQEIEDVAGHRLETQDETSFDSVKAALRRRAYRRIGAIRMSEQNLMPEATIENASILAKGIGKLGVSRLPWSKEQTQLRHRINFLHMSEGEASDWPQLSDDILDATIENWLSPFIVGRHSLSEISAAELSAALAHLIPYELMRRAEIEAPSFFETPVGLKHALDYSTENGPVLCVRVQELFGLTTHPTLARGRAALTLELLSPAHRPIQKTKDLPGFWKGSWSEVKKEMKGRYPKHDWPDDPAQAKPSTRLRPRKTD